MNQARNKEKNSEKVLIKIKIVTFACFHVNYHNGSIWGKGGREGREGKGGRR